MIDIDIRERENIAIITPKGRLTAASIAALAERINGYINETDRVPNLVIHARDLPFWQDFDALRAHLNFVKNHESIVRKVALVSDSKLLWVARVLVDQFVGAKVRRFNEDALDDAIGWAQMEEDNPGSITEMDGFPADVIAIELNGLITSQDYSDMLVPLVTERAKSHDKLKLLCVMGPYFDGYSAGAMWDDMRFGFGHLTTFSRIALVTDHDWIRTGAKFFGVMMPSEVVVFDMAELDDAKAWVRA